ncbi:TPA: hypothetical protein ACH9Y3_005765 [Escherichia coli]
MKKSIGNLKLMASWVVALPVFVGAGAHSVSGVSLDIENYCTLSSFFIISGFFGNVIFWMLRRSCGDIEHR